MFEMGRGITWRWRRGCGERGSGVEEDGRRWSLLVVRKRNWIAPVIKRSKEEKRSARAEMPT
jgi:hypothetical protein